MMESPDYLAETPDSEPFDALSEVLEAVRFVGGRIEEHASDAPGRATFSGGDRSLLIVRSGHLRIHSADLGETPIELGRRDIALFAFGSTFSISYPEPVSPEGDRREENEASAGVCEWLHGTFHIDEALAGRLVSALPKVVILRGIAVDAMDWLEIASAFALAEVRAREPGSSVMISRIIELLLVRVLRLWAIDPDSQPSWLVGAIDPAVGRALGVMHSSPGREWSVKELAQVAGLSRSVFTARFVPRVGLPPIKYLNGLRLDKAAEILRRTSWTITEVSEAVGYASDAAFSRAFKLRFGVSPSQWRR